jgi:hypothetical protein
MQQDPFANRYSNEVSNRWGNTAAYKQSLARISKMSATELDRVKKEAETITQKTADLMLGGSTSDSREIQEQMDLFFRHLRHFYDPSKELFMGLAEMYVADPRFSQVYEKRAKGFAQFMHDAMVCYANSLSPT